MELYIEAYWQVQCATLNLSNNMCLVHTLKTDYTTKTNLTPLYP